MKRYLCLMGTVILTLVFSVSSALAQTENYLSIGDSLAAGQTPYQQIDTGYSDLIAMKLGMTGQLSFYTKELAFPGYTTADVLKRVKSEEASNLLANATLITVSAGANDLLRLVQANPTAGTLAFSQLQTDYALNIARKNMEKTLEALKERAPKAKIYVMGYYFAYPNVHPSQKEGTNAQLVKLNTILQQQAEHAGAAYVNVYDDIGLNARNFLPNISDVHPNFEGYRQMANAFLHEYSGSKALAISSNELPKPNPISFDQILEQLVKAEQKQEEKEKTTPTARALPSFKGYAAFMEKVRAKEIF
ncbi:lysophospholipase [Lysinibacillus sphaericus]|uniref:SGNH/GDSL hydrolase family protein n=1 Tax=Lysinibacillus sphaericus TaxID=1421 RepID=UPI0018CEF14D|nr:SGNH/GDSL hydrolase family protein [Lysinibacillus sphaericus]MBG9454232.1 lysophospholipase [Lysinibacillus sphaericus]MBG9477171.1 lysophospholipase [Lysinibacillus sphaericus]MBG9593790.1 lysophospholipase [Lysinibacillus sphaericus]